MEGNIVQNKTYAFALRIVNLYKYLAYEKKEYVLSKQILRSGTSIGANVEEALGGQSKKDFVAKMSIAHKEARETKYWIKLLIDSNFLTKEISQTLFNECDEICKITAKIKITSNKNNF